MINLLPLLITFSSLLTANDSSQYPVSAEILFVGDAMQHQAQIDQAHSEANGNGYNYDDCFSLIAPSIIEADYAVCNLEVALGGGPRYTGYPCFSAPDQFAVALKKAGFDLFLTANNHTLDRLDRGLRRTINVLDSLEVDHIGTYHDKTQRDSLVPFIKEIKGIKVGFLNYTYGTNGLTASQGAEVALIDRKKIEQEINETRDAGAELLVVCMHWGVEYVLSENSEQRALAQFLVDKGCDMIIGGHPHVIQPMKIVRNEKLNKDVLIVYSLGNFISNMKTRDTRGGALVRCHIARDNNGNAIFVGADYDTFFSAKPTGKGSNFKIFPSWMAEKIPANQKNHWLQFENAAKNVFDAKNIKVEKRHK